MLLGVDVGGTFTDAVLLTPEASVAAKAPTTPGDQSRGVLAAIAAALEQAGARAADVTRFAHGMTVATNALLEGRTARTALVATAGFEDLVELGRQARPDLYRLCAAPPPPLAPPELRFGARERMTPAGVLEELSDAAAAELAATVEAARPEAVAVVLLHSYRHPAHERRAAAALRARSPQLHVSLSHEVVGTFREFERAATTEVDAAVSPLLRGYLARLAERGAAAGLPAPAVMQSNGGLVAAALAGRNGARTVLSGPAAGAAGAAAAARASSAGDALCLDMGGTSCDVCVVRAGAVEETAGGSVAGRPLALPMLAIHTVGAGGGSIAWADAGGALRVGPRSAGAEPGPACYGRGGREPTVTDADVVLGRIGDGVSLAGVRVDAAAARRAVGDLAARLDLGLQECAAGIARVADAEMATAVRLVSIARGLDPRDFALVAFGGAGPLHAAAIAAQLEITRVVCPLDAGVLAARGLVVAAPRRDAQRTVMLRGGQIEREPLDDLLCELGERARRELGDPTAELTAVYELRYRGQSFELAVEAPPGAAAADLRERFEAAHERRYGYRDDAAEIELVTVRASARGAAPAEPPGGAAGRRSERTERLARFGERELPTPVWRGAPAADGDLEGPAIVELPTTTVAVPPGWRWRASAHAIELRSA